MPRAGPTASVQRRWRPLPIVFRANARELTRVCTLDFCLKLRVLAGTVLLEKKMVVNSDDSPQAEGRHQIVIQALDPGDLRLIEPLWKELNDHHLERSTDFADHYRTLTFDQRIKRFFTHQKRILIEVACDELTKDIIGYCISSVDYEIRGRIESLYFRPAYRNQGIGSRLVRSALRYLEDSKTTDISVDVAAGNEEAFAFYARFGFALRMHVLELQKAAGPDSL